MVETGIRLCRHRSWPFWAACAAPLIASLAADLTGGVAEAYPDLEYGQDTLAKLAVIVAVPFAFGFAVVQLWRRRFFGALLLLASAATPFFLPRTVDAQHWKFKAHESEYIAAVRADPSRSPKYKYFEWSNRNTSLGGGVLIDAIVFDESDEIARDPSARSEQWKELRTQNSPREDFWIAAGPKPGCRYYVKPYGAHFYYVVLVCP